MGKVRIEWNLPAFEEIRREPGVDDFIAEHVDSVAAVANSEIGEGYIAGVEAGASRTRGYVVTSSFAAVRDNAKNNTLIRALGQ